MGCREELEEILRSGRTLTNLEAFQVMKNKTMNLPKVVMQLRDAGVPVEDQWERTSTGKKVKRYFIRARVDAA